MGSSTGHGWSSGWSVREEEGKLGMLSIGRSSRLGGWLRSRRGRQGRGGEEEGKNNQERSSLRRRKAAGRERRRGERSAGERKIVKAPVAVDFVVFSLCEWLGFKMGLGF